MTTIIIGRELLEQALGQLICNTNNMQKGMSKSIQKLCARENAEVLERLRTALAAPATAPAWHVAPTVPGLWFCDEGDENPYRFTCHNVSIPLNPHLVGEGERWYGPIPEDKP